MGHVSRASTNRSSPRVIAIALFLCGAVFARPASAFQAPPEHLVAGNQYFDASPSGFEAYLKSIRETRPDLFAQLAPDADRLASRFDLGVGLAVGGVAAGIGSAIYGVASQKTCAEPQLSDPNFGADSAAWGQCNHDNIAHIATFGFIGGGLMAAGLIAALAVSPTHADLIDLVNKNNRLSPEPLRLELGYDPTQRLARAGATLFF